MKKLNLKNLNNFKTGLKYRGRKFYLLNICYPIICIFQRFFRCPLCQRFAAPLKRSAVKFHTAGVYFSPGSGGGEWGGTRKSASPLLDFFEKCPPTLGFGVPLAPPLPPPLSGRQWGVVPPT